MATDNANGSTDEDRRAQAQLATIAALQEVTTDLEARGLFENGGLNRDGFEVAGNALAVLVYQCHVHGDLPVDAVMAAAGQAAIHAMADLETVMAHPDTPEVWSNGAETQRLLATAVRVAREAYS